MIRAIARRLLLIIALSASILAFGAFSRVSAYELYELTNLIQNGDMSDDANADGLADLWSVYNVPVGGSYRYITGGVQFIKFEYTSALFYQVVEDYGNQLIGGHIYYMSFYATNIDEVVFVTPVQTTVTTNAPNGNNSYRFVAAGTGEILRFLGETVSSVSSFDNVMLFDLTAQFGAGNEPSITDFELLYLPDMDYFDDYGSFIEDSYTDFSSSDYTQLGDDLTGINYSRSIIDTYGTNIDIDIYAYFFDTPDLDGDDVAWFYHLLNNPLIKWGSKTETLSWNVSNYSDRVLLLDMDDDQEELAKRALFDRNIGGTINGDADAGDNGYMSFVLEPTTLDYVKFYIVFSSVFDLRVDLSAVMLSYEMDNGTNEFGIAQECYFKFEDKYSNIIAPSLRGNLSDYGTYVINDFGSQYTDVSAFNVEFEFTTPEPAEDDITFYLYELGAFSSNDVVFGFIAPELPLPFEPGVCDWYEFGCQAKNGANEFVAWFYEKLDIAEIVGYFETIIDGGSTVISLMPDSVVAAFTVIGAGIILAISLAILDKVKGNGG